MKANRDKFQFIIIENKGSYKLQFGEISLVCYTTWYYLVLLAQN